jgi:hypothetical protein
MGYLGRVGHPNRDATSGTLSGAVDAELVRELER